MSGPHRIAAFATFAVPLVFVVALFGATALSRATSGAGLSEDDRPIGFVLMAVIAAAGWVIGTSLIASVHVRSARLPRGVGAFASCVIWRSARPPTDESFATSLTTPRLLWLAVVELPLFLFLAPILLGLLLQPVVYRPVEAGSVLAMGVVVAGWSAVLIASVLRSLEPGRPPGDIDAH